MTITKFKHDQRNHMMHPYNKFELNEYNHYKDNEWKLKISTFYKVEEV
jgi:hypothetical protein